jgi:hypothetical protein
MPYSNISEGLEKSDLKRLVHPELHIDEFKSKMGRDEDIIVLSFKLTGREPAEDLVSFVEKGYDWVIDADVSSGEMGDGDYIVFVECDRTPDAAENIMEMMKDIIMKVSIDINNGSFESIENYLPNSLRQMVLLRGIFMMDG